MLYVCGSVFVGENISGCVVIVKLFLLAVCFYLLDDAVLIESGVRRD